METSNRYCRVYKLKCAGASARERSRTPATPQGAPLPTAGCQRRAVRGGGAQARTRAAVAPEARGRRRTASGVRLRCGGSGGDCERLSR